MAAKSNKTLSLKGEPTLSGTLSLTRRTFGLQGKLANVGVSGYVGVAEEDIIGLRENKFMLNGRSSAGQFIKRTPVGYNIAGFGFEKSQDMLENTITTKNTLPFYSQVSTRNISDNAEIYSGSQVNLFSFKAGFYYGVEASLNLNFLNTQHVAPFYSGGMVSESTQIRIFVPELPQ